MPEEFEVDLEPTPITDDELNAESNDGSRRAKSVKERNEDVEQLKEHLPDLRLNLLTNKMEYGSRTSPQIMKGDDLETLTVKLAVENNIYIPEPRMRVATRYLAKANEYCPIKRYLMDCCYQRQPFPEWEIIGEVLLGSKDKLATTILQRFLIGAVARAYKPGCSMSWIPILIGKQGCGKSQLIRELVPEELYSEVTLPLELLMKEIYRLHTSWVTELPEVDNYFHVRNIENFKNLITTRTDETRFPYQALPVQLKRRFVMIGTSNRSEFLVDPTGNRRFMPLELAPDFETPWRELPDFRARMWAKAIEQYEAGVGWELQSGEIAELHDYIQSFAISDPWEAMVEEYLTDKDETTLNDVLIYGLSLSAQSVTPKESRRVSSILTALGWRRQVTTRNGSSIRLWRSGKSKQKKKSKLTDF